MTVALTSGAITSMSAVTKQVLFAASGVPNAAGLIQYTLGEGPQAFPFSGPVYDALRTNAAPIRFAIWKNVDLALQSRDGTKSVYGALVNGDFFSVLGLKPVEGRFFSSGSDSEGANGWPAVISYRFWKSHFNGNTQTIGERIQIDGALAYIAGVLPQKFHGMNPPQISDILLPRRFDSILDPSEDRFSRLGYFEWSVFSRVPRGEELSTIQVKLHVVEPRVVQAADPNGKMLNSYLFPTLTEGRLIFARHGVRGFLPDSVSQLLDMIDAFGVLLVLLCVCNLALLSGGRGAAQRRECSIRLALGASRLSLVKQAVREAFILALIGCVLGVPLAWIGTRVFSQVVAGEGAFNSFPILHPRVIVLLIAGCAAVVIAASVMGAVTIWQSKRPLCLALGTGDRATSGSSRWLIGIEVCVAIVVMAFTALSLIGIHELSHQPSGFSNEHTFIVDLSLIRREFPKSTDEKLGQIATMAASSPGVYSVSSMDLAPLEGYIAKANLAVHLRNGALREQTVWPEKVTLGYFQAAGTRVIRGRDFSWSDLHHSVCVISRRAAVVLFQGENPLNRTLYSSASGSALKPYCQVVGVAEDAHLQSMTVDPVEAVYTLSDRWQPTLIVRAAGAAPAIEAVRKAAESVAPGGLSSAIESVEQHINEDLRLTRFVALFAVLCAGFTAVILAAGLSGILALEVSARKRTIGIQMALGANRMAITRSLAKRFAWPIFTGSIIGSALAAFCATQVTSRLPLDKAIMFKAYACAYILLLVVMLIGIFVPLRRAFGISPADCLRSE